MDGMDDLFSAFADFPGFSAFSMVNRSGTCATSRILQTRWMGCHTGEGPGGEAGRQAGGREGRQAGRRAANLRLCDHLTTISSSCVPRASVLFFFFTGPTCIRKAATACPSGWHHLLLCQP